MLVGCTDSGRTVVYVSRTMPRCKLECVSTSLGLPAAAKDRVRRELVRAVTGVMTVVAVLAVIIGGQSTPAHAAGERVTVSTPVGQFVVSGQPTLLKITVEADSLTVGKIVVTSDSSSPSTLPVEIPGGTAKELTVVAPPLMYFGDQYRVELQDNAGKRLADATLSPALRPGDSVVGVFPSLAAGMPDTERSAIEVTCHLFAFDPTQFDYSIAGVAGYDVLVATPDEIAKLTDDALGVVDSWLANGGRLVIDAEPTDTAVPDDWRPGNGNRANFGNGEVVFAAGAIDAGDWHLATAPVSARSAVAQGELAQTGMATGGFESLTTSLARFTNASITSALTLVIAIAVYALLVGPGLYFAFKRRRARIWIAAPAVAVLATAGVWLAGQRQRANITNAHGVVISVNDAGSEATSYELQFATKTGQQTLKLPEGFIVDAPMWSDVSVLTIDGAPTGNLVEQAATSGSFSLFSGRGLVPEYDRALVATGRIDGNKLVGTVENHLSVRLTDVAVFWNNGTINVGDIEPSGSVDFEVKAGDPMQMFMPLPIMAWPDAVPNSQEMFGFAVDDGFGPDGGPAELARAYNPDTDVAVGLWDDYAFAHPESATGSSQFAVAGWSREIPNPIDPDTVGTTMVAVNARVETAAGDPTGSVGIISSEPGNDLNRWSVNALMQLGVPEKVRDDDVSPLVVTRPRNTGNLEVFVDGDWIALNDQHSLVEIPDGAISDTGVVYVRCDLYPDTGIETPVLKRAAGEVVITPFNEAIGS